MLSDTQKKILAAIESGHTTTRDIAAAAGLRSNSNVMRQLTQLAVEGHVILESGAHGLTVSTGRDFCQAWDAAARLAGNPDA